MADSLRDYFVRLLFKSEGAEKAREGIKGIERGLDSATAKAFSFNEQINAIKNIIAPFQALGALIDRTAQEADALGDLSDRTGIATDQLEKFGYIAKLSGTNQETFVTGMKFLEKNMSEVTQGSKAQIEAFAKLGVSVRGANGKIKTTQEILPELSAAFKKLPDHATKTAYAMQIFGKAGQELLPMLEKGPDKIREMQEELELLGGVTSETFLKAASDYADNVDRLTAVWKGLRQAISGPVVQALNRIADSFMAWWKAVGALIRSRVAEWSEQLVTSLQALWTTANKFSTALLVMAAALNVPLLAMIAIRLALLLLIDDFANWIAGNDSLIGRIIKNWDAWLDKVAETQPTLAAALATVGDIVGYVGKKLQALPAEWDKFVEVITDGTWTDAVKQMFRELGDFMLAPITQTWSKIQGVIFDAMLKMKAVARSLGLDSLADSIGSGASGLMKTSAGDVAMGVGSVLLQGVTGGLAGGNSTNNVQTSINVTAGPGMNERGLAEEIKKQFNMEMDSQLRSAYNVTVPEAY